MNQILHIFAKDTRRFWPEILLSLAALAALVFAYPLERRLPVGTLGMQERNALLSHYGLLNLVCYVLIFGAWALLTARIVHEESLVGDRQFWITRPYGWKQLLAAKILFLAVYLYLPLVAAQCLCMVSVGVSPFAGIPSIARYLFLLTGLVVLPVTAIAAVTANPSRLILTAIGALVCGQASTMIWHRSSFWSFSFLQLPGLWNSAVCLTLLCAVAIALQYATRRTALVRGFLIVGAVGSVLSSNAFPTQPSSRQMLQKQVLQTGSFTPITQAPFQLAYSPSEMRPGSAVLTRDYDHKPVVDFRFPMRYQALGTDAAIHLEMFSVELQGADGFHWSTMQNEFWPTEYHAQMRFSPGFFVPPVVYDRLRNGPATVKLTLYYDDLQPADTVRSNLSAGSFDLPGSVHCSSGGTYAWLDCRTAALQAPILNVNADYSTSPCSAQQELEEGAGPWWSGFGYEEFYESPLVPIRRFFFTFMRGRNNATEGAHLCMGAPVTFTHYRNAGRKQATFTFTMPDLPVVSNPYKI